MAGRASEDAEDEAAVLAGRLRARRSEIEQAVLLRLSGVANPQEETDPVYVEGLLKALSDAVDYALEAIEAGEDRAPPVPPGLFAQARRAARNGVSIETVLRRYLAGHNVVGEYLMAEAESARTNRSALVRIVRDQGVLLDQLLAGVSEDYHREAATRVVSPQQRRAAQIKRLLTGETIDPAGLNYDLDGFHIGLIASGHGAGAAQRKLAKSFGKRLLLLTDTDEAATAWLGSQRSIEADEFEQILRQAEDCLTPRGSVAFGERAEGIGGWRLTHQQAAAAFPLALRVKKRIVRYADVALLTAIARDPTLAASLEHLYPAPLAAARGGGEMLEETLRVYFSCSRNVTSAAKVLGVSRPTVRARLQEIEERIGRSLNAAGAELELALSLRKLASPIGAMKPIVPRW